MVQEKFNRSGYIGGSDASWLYASYSSASFKKWWNEKVTSIRTSEFSNVHTQAGNILESEIMKTLNIPKPAWNLRFFKEGTLAGVNTDATEVDKGIVHEIKTALHSYLFKWLHAKAGVSIDYRRQVFHGLYVAECDVAKVHVLPMSEEEKRNPFLVENITDRIHTFEYTRDQFDFVEHDWRVRYLTFCYNENQTPTDPGLEIFKMHKQ